VEWLSIGDVVAAVQRRYPSITASKIRYLESRGLVTPARTTGGTRRYSRSDVDLILEILRLQTEEFLPLDIISERLSVQFAAVNANAETDSSARVTRPPVPIMDTEQFLGRTGLTLSLLEACQDQGLIDRLDAQGVVIGRLVAKLGEHGLEPRHLRSIRLSAERVVDLVDKTIIRPAKDVGEAGAGETVSDPRTEVLGFLIDLHTSLLRGVARD
jgi:DNA-binding transcriptional MerR regulator